MCHRRRKWNMRKQNKSVKDSGDSLIPTTFFSTCPPSSGLTTSTVTGTTISLLEAPSHAMWPGNASTSGTSCVCFVAAAVPHTPRPKSMVWHATWPMKGPRMRLLPCEVGSRT